MRFLLVGNTALHVSTTSRLIDHRLTRIVRTSASASEGDLSGGIMDLDATVAPEMSSPSASIAHGIPPKQPPLTDLQKWGLDLSSEHLLSGISPWPTNPPIEEDAQPLSSLGHFADNLYKLGAITLPEYHAQLAEFIHVAFPRVLRKELENALEAYTTDGAGRQAWDVQKIIWQTDKDESRKDDRTVRSWSAGQAQGQGWQYEMVTDASVEPKPWFQEDR